MARGRRPDDGEKAQLDKLTPQARTPEQCNLYLSRADAGHHYLFRQRRSGDTVVEELLRRIACGEKRHSIGRTIGEGDFSALVNLNWTIGPIHTDSEHMRSTSFGERILPGVCVLSTTIGLANTSRVRELTAAHGLKLVALLGFENVRFAGPVYPGDTLTAVSVTEAKRESESSEGRGVITWFNEGFNQHGNKVIEFRRSNLAIWKGQMGGAKIKKGGE